jgi:hypothetical protein
LEVPVTLLRVVASENTNNYTTITNYKGTISNLVGDVSFLNVLYRVVL